MKTKHIERFEAEKKGLIPATSLQTPNVTEIVAILTTIKDRNAMIRMFNFRMAQTASLQDAETMTSVVIEEADFIIAVEDRTTLVIVETLAAPMATIVVEDVEKVSW